MKALYTILLISLLSTYVSSQSCLTEGITFTSQQEIDDFASNYPGCMEIEGDVRIQEAISGSISSLTGLSQLNLLGGDLFIYRNDALSSLTGLENITSISGRFFVADNAALASLMGCHNLISVEEGITIGNNDLLTDFTGLDNVASIAGYLRVYDNASLKNLIGLGSVTSIGAGLSIYNSPSLTSFSGLDNVVSVGSDVSVYNNAALTDFTGLDNLSSTGGVFISENVSLISLTGLENLDSIKGDYFLDDNTALTSITGLNNLVFVSGKFYFGGCTVLTSLTGLDNLSSIGGKLTVYDNAVLTSLAPLSNVTFVGGDMVIGENHTLTNLVGLENITSIGGVGYLLIVINDALTSLTGIQNIDKSSIQFLRILDNPNLPDCEVQSVCEYLDNGGPSEIGNNKAGCNTTQEIMNACTDPPACTNLTMPGNGSSNVNISTDLSWTPVNVATGYKLTVGTTAGGADIMDNVDVGNVTTYDPGDLPCGEEIFVTIIPFNWTADASSCAEESFTTEDVTANAGSDIALCHGGSTQLQASGGNTYSWSPTTGLDDPGIANPIASADSTTTYTVTVSKDGRCPATDEVEVTINPLPVPNASATDETGQDLEDGTATSLPTGGTPDYSYAWSNGDTTQSISGLAPGQYIVSVSDANACVNLDTVVVGEFVCLVLNVNSRADNASCFGICDGSIAILSVDNGAAPITYSWNSGASSATLNSLCPDEYIVTITDASNCSISDTFAITQPGELVIIVDSTRGVGSQLLGYIAITTNNTGNYIFAWSGPGGFTAVTEGIDSLREFGCYTLMVTDTLTNCSMDSTICLDALTSVIDLESLSSRVILYPNPASGKFTLDFSSMSLQTVTISLIDVSGKVRATIYKAEMDDYIEFTTENLNSGLYIIQIQSKEFGIFYKKVIVSK